MTDAVELMSTVENKLEIIPKFVPQTTMKSKRVPLVLEVSFTQSNEFENTFNVENSSEEIVAVFKNSF